MLKALAGHTGPDGAQTSLLPARLGVTNARYTLFWAVLVFVAIAAVVVVIGGGRDQELVLFYAVAVFISFLMGLAAMARFALLERRTASLVMNVSGAVVVLFTIGVNLLRGFPLVFVAAALLIALLLYRSWVRPGRPGGIAHAVVHSHRG